MASTEKETPEVLFLRKPGAVDEVVAQVTDSPISPHTIELGRREAVLRNIVVRALRIQLTRASLFTIGLPVGLDGVFRVMVGGVLPFLSSPESRSPLESSYHIVGGLMEAIAGAGFLSMATVLGREELGRLALINNRWVERKMKQIPLDQPPTLVEVAPQG